MNDRDTPQKGDQHWATGCIATVRRVSTGRWADIHVQQANTGAEWTKRQPLPFPADWIKTEARGE